MAGVRFPSPYRKAPTKKELALVVEMSDFYTSFHRENLLSGQATHADMDTCIGQSDTYLASICYIGPAWKQSSVSQRNKMVKYGESCIPALFYYGVLLSSSLVNNISLLRLVA